MKTTALFLALIVSLIGPSAFANKTWRSDYSGVQPSEICKDASLLKFYDAKVEETCVRMPNNKIEVYKAYFNFLVKTFQVNFYKCSTSDHQGCTDALRDQLKAAKVFESLSREYDKQMKEYERVKAETEKRKAK